MKPFLTAEWRNLLNVTYPVPPEILRPHVPKGVELDVQDGRAFASIVAFDFLETKVRGLRIPFHVNFPEINLRFYVKYGGERGVVFIRELVPRPCIALVARRIYNEPYRSTRMRSQAIKTSDHLEITHDFRWKGRDQYIEARASLEAFTPPADSTEHYFKEHQWGFGITHRGNTLRYRVEHPVWRVFPLESYRLDMDFAALYGPEWAFLADTEPINALLAEGSPVAVYPAGGLSD